MIKHILENNGIESSLKDEVIGSRGGGWRPAGNVKVIVSDLDYDKAKMIVDEYINNLK